MLRSLLSTVWDFFRYDHSPRQSSSSKFLGSLGHFLLFIVFDVFLEVTSPTEVYCGEMGQGDGWLSD